MDLFELSQENSESLPLAERFRPKSLADFVDTQGVLKNNPDLASALKSKGPFPNFIFWGPPGTGKTTLAQLIAAQRGASTKKVSAIDIGTKGLKEIGDQARYLKQSQNQETLLFLDEIHRLNKSQQDVLLPYCERRDFSLIGATTENPSYELNRALLSRCRVILFEPISNKDLHEIALGLFGKMKKDPELILKADVLQAIVQSSQGDARRLINTIETLLNLYEFQSHEIAFPIELERLDRILDSQPPPFDKAGDLHYDTISAFIKSIRGSDADAAVYYLARLLEAGESPVFIARRLVISASEDVGNADPRALPLAIAGLQAVELIGLPEAEINLSQVTTYLACAPKSNRAYSAIKDARQEVKNSGSLPIPKSLRSAQTAMVQNLGFGKGYKYAHEGATGWQEMEFLPENLKGRKFYEPSDIGFEKTLKDYQAWKKQKK